MGDMGSAIPSSSPFYSFPLLLLLLNSLLLLIYLCLPPLLCLEYWLRFSKKYLRPHMHIYYGYCIEGRLAYMPSLLMTAVRAANLEVNIWNRRAPKTFTLSSSYCWDGRTSFANRCWGEKRNSGVSIILITLGNWRLFKQQLFLPQSDIRFDWARPAFKVLARATTSSEVLSLNLTALIILGILKVYQSWN